MSGAQFPGAQFPSRSVVLPMFLWTKTKLQEVGFGRFPGTLLTVG